MFIHISKTLEMISCSFLNLITALVHQLSGISWKHVNCGYTRSISCHFCFHNFPSFNTAAKKWQIFVRINDYLGKMHIFSSSYLLSNLNEEIYVFFLPSNAHNRGSRLVEQLFERPAWLTANLVLVIIWFNSNNWSIDLFGTLTRQFAPRTIGRWCENTKIIVDFGAFDHLAVIIFLRDWRFIIFVGFG